jgi:hypothetical protein
MEDGNLNEHNPEIQIDMNFLIEIESDKEEDI